ncbi:hypothetical protein ACH5RR_023060 [Cinchona calisaya]|uniref:Uncharacterized protein n=1 Tax=Cinchona calisaya TaxID=153742 RepID=A0ABD2ZAM4_9GENT
MDQDQPCIEQQQPHASTTLPKNSSPKTVNDSTKHGVQHKTLATAANLANLLPTGTVLAFRTLTPSFSNKGSCQPSNKFITAFLIGFCAIICFFSSFTDSFTDDHDGKLYYGIATCRGLYIFNDESRDQDEKSKEEDRKELSKFKIRWIDFVHAFVSLFVFLIFAVSDTDVQSCFFPEAGGNMDALMMNLPLGAGIFSSFLFTIFPTTRRGIGYADLPTSIK